MSKLLLEFEEVKGVLNKLLEENKYDTLNSYFNSTIKKVDILEQQLKEYFENKDVSILVKIGQSIQQLKDIDFHNNLREYTIEYRSKRRMIENIWNEIKNSGQTKKLSDSVAHRDDLNQIAEIYQNLYDEDYEREIKQLDEFKNDKTNAYYFINSLNHLTKNIVTNYINLNLLNDLEIGN